MMNSYDYVEARVADHRSHAEERRRTAVARRQPTQRLGNYLRQRAVKPTGLDTER